MSRPTTLGQMVDSHAGDAALILGGGLGLPAEFEAAYAAYPGALLLSVNHHGCLLGVGRHRDGPDLLAIRRELGEREPRLVMPHYAVHVDDMIDCVPDLACFEVERISASRGAHVQLLEFPRGTGSSGRVAAWVAYMLGCAPVILCGMDCYSRGSYWHSPNAVTSGNSSPPGYHAAEWRDLLPSFMPAEIVRAAGGPLVGIFGPLEPGLTFPSIDKDLELREIYFTRSTEVGGNWYHPAQNERPPDRARFPYKVACRLVETGCAHFT